MRACIALSVALLAAAEDHASASLRGSRSLSSVVENMTGPQANATAGAPEPLVAGNVTNVTQKQPNAAPLVEALVASNASLEDVSEPLPLLSSSGSGWYQGGDKMWGGGTGVESINWGNVGYYDRGMDAARAHCGGAGCALIVNPPGHRTINHAHIHFVHYKGYGANLKRRLEHEVCGREGWHGGGLPCGGKAAFFPGFPGVFSKALAAGSIRHASVIAWPESCGGRGTIVELAYGCSIEHQIRGDYNPRLR